MLERKIQEAFSHATPDVWEQIQERCEQEGENETEGLENNFILKAPSRIKKHWIGKIAGFVAVATLFGIGTIYGIQHYQSNHVVASVLSLGENAGINIVVNSEGTVLEVKALNENDYIVITNLQGYTLKDVINEIITLLEKYNYLVEDTNLIIGIDCEENEFYSAQNKVRNMILMYMEDRSIHVEIIDQSLTDKNELRNLVQTYHITFSLAEKVQSALVVTSMYTVEELIEMDFDKLTDISYPGNGRTETLLDGTEISDEGVLYKWNLVEMAYNHLIEQGIMVDKFDIECYGSYYSLHEEKWLLSVYFLDKVANESGIRMKYLCKVDKMTGEIDSYEVRVSEESIQTIVLEDAYHEEQYDLGEVVGEVFVGTVIEDYYNMVYEVLFRTENYRVCYQLDLKDGTILKKQFTKRGSE